MGFQSTPSPIVPTSVKAPRPSMGALNSSSNLTVQPVKTHEQIVSNQADIVLQQHGADGKAHEVEALKNILNNINVQTKKTSDRGN